VQAARRARKLARLRGPDTPDSPYVPTA